MKLHHHDVASGDGYFGSVIATELGWYDCSSNYMLVLFQFCKLFAPGSWNREMWLLLTVGFDSLWHELRLRYQTLNAMN
jgi:hypothetical protein